MDNENKNINATVEDISAGSVVSAATEQFDRCPMCDNPTPVVNGRCTCTHCGHSWYAGSH